MTDLLLTSDLPKHHWTLRHFCIALSEMTTTTDAMWTSVTSSGDARYVAYHLLFQRLKSW